VYYVINLDWVVYATGDSLFGQLGIPSCKQWSKVDLIHVMKISCGLRHTLFLSSNDVVYGSGNGLKGALGHINQKLFEPIKIINVKSKVLHFEFIHPDQFLVAQSGFIVQRIATDGTILKTYQGHQGPFNNGATCHQLFRFSKVR
jgi:alpha-tubulin suppressor-like RCC1 family protein